MSGHWRLASVMTFVTAVACATLPAGSYRERGLDMRSYRGYAWQTADVLPAGDPRLDRDPAFRDRLQGSIEKALMAKGLRLSEDAPDLRIHVHATSMRRLEVAPAQSRVGSCVDEACEARVVTDSVVVLILDILDARTGQLVWRGWTEVDIDRLVKSDGRAAHDLAEAANRMIAELPVAAPVQQER